MKIPSNNKWTQTNDGDTFGVLHETKNITLDKQGKLRLSKKAILLHDDTDGIDDSNFGATMAINYFVSHYYLVTSIGMFRFLLGGVAIAAISGEPNGIGVESDSLIINDHLYVTSDDDISRLNTSITWDIDITTEALGTGVPHPIENFDSLTTYKVAVGDGNLVHVYDETASPASGTSLVLPTQYVVTSLAYRNGYLYVGTKNTDGGEARIFVWDGATANANYDIPVGSNWIFSVFPYKGTVGCVTNAGQLLAVSGNSVIQLGAFPVYYDPNSEWQGNSRSVQQKVFNRGVKVVGDNIYISIDGSTDTGFIPEMISGIWVYDPEVGLTHRHSITADKTVTDAGITASGETLTTAATHLLKKGDGFEFTVVSGLTGIATKHIYYADPQTADTLKVAKSRKALSEGNYVTFGGSATTDAMEYAPNTDWGQIYASEGQAIGLISPSATPLKQWATPIVFGAQFNDLDNNSQQGIFVLGENFNIGSFSTQRINASGIEQAWKNLTVYLDRLNNSGEEIIVKYRTNTDLVKSRHVFKGTWSGNNKITVTGANDTDEYNDIDVGDEIVMVDRYGRGYTAHVTGIDGSLTLTLDESVGTDTELVEFIVTDFKKIDSFASTREMPSYITAPLNKPDGWVEFKAELRGFEIEVSHLDLSNSVSKRSV